MTAGSEAEESAELLPIAVVDIAWEGVDTAVLGMSRDDPQPTSLMNVCRAVLAAYALEPDDVIFVIAGDFVESVKARLPAGPYRDTYDETRGAGTVGGKTMTVGDQIHVVFHAWLFLDPDAVEAEGWDEEAVSLLRKSADARARQVRRTIVHEARHVAIAQAGEANLTLDGVSWQRQNFVSVAQQVIEEYRAELAVPMELREQYEVELPVDSLTALREDLRRIAMVEYQQHLDVGRLAYDVTQQSHHAWKALAYVAAARRVFNVPLADPVPPRVASAEDWLLMADPHWAAFEDLLSHIPDGSVRISSGQLDDVTNEVADLLVDWLRTLGFVWSETHFLIESWDLMV